MLELVEEVAVEQEEQHQILLVMQVLPDLFLMEEQQEQEHL
tara:strand:+ start:202 stop:324 length:123 start_codon:yes stop_codon:yes gene_type:complete